MEDYEYDMGDTVLVQTQRADFTAEMNRLSDVFIKGLLINYSMDKIHNDGYIYTWGNILLSHNKANNIKNIRGYSKIHPCRIVLIEKNFYNGEKHDKWKRK
jgi:hypothetical protein